jgi:predicted DNA-binding ribbon-helix-helix protein
MKSTIVKRSLAIGGRKTSVSLEDEFWKCIKELAAAQDMKLYQLVSAINESRTQGNLSSAIRVYVLDSYRKASAIAEQMSQNRRRRRMPRDTFSSF